MKRILWLAVPLLLIVLAAAVFVYRGTLPDEAEEPAAAEEPAGPGTTEGQEPAPEAAEPESAAAEIIEAQEAASEAPSEETVRAELIEPLLSFYPGTAGSSLGRAAAAARVLAFADRYGAVGVSIGEEDRKLFAENAASVAELLQETRADFEGTAGLYSDAGVYETVQELAARPGIWEKCDALMSALAEVKPADA